MLNIYSGSPDSFCASLTFPTELAFFKKSIKQNFPVKFGNVTYPDAESLYLNNKESYPIGVERLTFCVYVAVLKFQQYPELVQGIINRGGVTWLETCEHITFAKTERFKKWEGLGRDSQFISCLIRAFEIVNNLPLSHSKFLDQPKQLTLF